MSGGSNPPENSKLPRNIVALGFVSLFTDIATEMMYPLIPVFLTFLGAGAMALGVIEGVAETTAALLKLYSGVLSDRLKKRKLLVVLGYGLSSLVRPFTGAVAGAWEIVAIRTLDRVGKGIRTAPRDALLAASAGSGMRGKAFGFDRAMDHTGAVIGPLIAAAVFLWFVSSSGLHDITQSMRWTFYFSALPGAAALCVAAFAVREAADDRTSKGMPSFSLRSFDRNFLTYTGIVLLFTLGNSSDAFLLFRAEETVRQSSTFYALITGAPLIGPLISRIGDPGLQRTVTAILFLPLIWAYFHILKAVLSTPLGALSDRIGRKRVICGGWGIYAIVYACFAGLDRLPGSWQVPATFILFGIYAFYYAMTEGTEKAFVADLVQPEVRASAFGLYNFAVGAGALPASILFGILYTGFGGMVAFGAGALLALAAVVLLLLRVHERR